MNTQAGSRYYNIAVTRFYHVAPGGSFLCYYLGERNWMFDHEESDEATARAWVDAG